MRLPDLHLFGADWTHLAVRMHFAVVTLDDSGKIAGVMILHCLIRSSVALLFAARSAQVW